MRSTETIKEMDERNTAINTIYDRREIQLNTQKDEQLKLNHELLEQSEKISKQNQSMNESQK